jgi:N-acetylornithine carbamoyltransferase
VVVLRPEAYALPRPLAMRAARAAARGGGSFRESSDRTEALEGAAIVYAKSWGSAACYGDAAAESAARGALGDWCVDEPWFENAPAARFFHCLPVRRNVVVADAVLDGPRSAVVHQAHQRLWAQTAVLHRLLATKEEA